VQEGRNFAAFTAGEWWISYRSEGIGDGNLFLREFNDNSAILGLRRATQPHRRREAISMKFKFVSAVLFGGLVFGVAAPANAAPKGYQNAAQDDGYTIRRRKGGYSYNYGDSINTDARGKAGGSGYSDPRLYRQSPGGPFDSGFFFDSGVGSPYGGQAPFMH
jgi:hypothetical protein